MKTPQENETCSLPPEPSPAMARPETPLWDAAEAIIAESKLIDVGSLVIPVGEEPSRHKPSAQDAGLRARISRERMGRKTEREPIRNADGFFQYRNRLEELRVFVMETQRHLTRAEIAVWLAIHNCQKRGVATIGQERISELTGTSKRHVGLAIKSLENKGLLKVLFKGKFVRNGVEGSGLASRYRVFPTPQSPLANASADMTDALAAAEPGL